MAEQVFVTEENLQHYDEKIKQYIDKHDAAPLTEDEIKAICV